MKIAELKDNLLKGAKRVREHCAAEKAFRHLNGQIERYSEVE